MSIQRSTAYYSGITFKKVLPRRLQREKFTKEDEKQADREKGQGEDGNLVEALEIATLIECDVEEMRQDCESGIGFGRRDVSDFRSLFRDQVVRAAFRTEHDGAGMIAEYFFVTVQAVEWDELHFLVPYSGWDSAT